MTEKTQLQSQRIFYWKRLDVLIRNRSVDFFRKVLTRILILETLRKSDNP